MRNEILKLLEDNFPGIDFLHETNLTSSDLLDSLSVVTVIGLIRVNLGVTIPTSLMNSKNFESLDSICSTVEKAKELTENHHD